MSKLAWDDLHKLSVLAAEKADDATLPMDDRERWTRVAGRLIEGSPTSGDLRAVAELAEVDAALQRDVKVRQRYLDLARRSREAGMK